MDAMEGIERSPLHKAWEAGDNVFRVGQWSGLTPEQFTIWLVGFSISHPSSEHSERMTFAWGFLHAYLAKEAFIKAKQE